MPTSHLTFITTPGTVVLGVLIVLATAVLAYLSWQRAVKKRRMGWLELLRVVIALCIAITLNQPEWRESFKPDQRPVLAVLHDISRSMETRDVISNDQPADAPASRAESIQALTDKALWQSLEKRLEVVIEPFSSSLDKADEGTDINGALMKILEQQPHLRSVVLASDGDWNTGNSPAQAATQLRMKNAPVFAVPAGAETRLPDVWIASFDAPTYGVAGKPLRIPFVIESSLPREQPITLSLQTSTGETVTQELTLPAMGRVQDSLVWRPVNTGDVKLTLQAPPVPGERYPDNNSLEAPVSIRKEELRVLIIESTPRWEYRYMRNAMERDPGVEVNILLFHPGLDKMGGGRGYLDAFSQNRGPQQV